MMFVTIRRRLTFANVAMTLALVFAMSGGAYAASKVIITSTKQISPKVIKQLTGKTGKTGPAGQAGAAGAVGSPGPQGAAGAPGKEGVAGKEGAAGKEGSPWTAGGTLPSGQTLKGVWNLWTLTSGLQTVGGSFSFGIPLAKAPAAHWIMADGEEATATGEQPSTVCLGKVSEPTAKPGNLCVYTESEGGISTTETFSKEVQIPWKWGMFVCNMGESQALCEPGTADRFGFGVLAVTEEEGYVWPRGTWAVTAE